MGSGAEDNLELASSSLAVLLVISAGFVADVAKDMAIANSFGATELADAFFVSYTIPFAIITTLLSAGRAVLVPVFTKVSAGGGKHDVWRLARSLIIFATAASALISVCGVLIAPWLIRLIGAGLSPGGASVASSMAKLMFLALMPTPTVVVLGSVLFALRRFSLPSAMNLIRAVAMLLSLALFGSSLGIHAASAGLVLGVISQWLLVMLACSKLGFRLLSLSEVECASARDTLSSLLLPVGTGLLSQNSRMLERALATLLVTGSVAAISNAYRIAFSITALLAGSVLWAALPTMSADAADGNKTLLAEHVAAGVKMILLVVLPVSISIVICSRPIVQALFERGAFDVAATSLTASALRWYALGMPSISLLPVYNGMFYALGKVRVPVWNDVILVVANLGFDVLLIRKLGIGGLALGYSLAGILAWCRMVILAKREVGKTATQRMVVFVTRLTAAGIVMACGLAVVYSGLSRGVGPESWLGQTIILALSLFFASGLFYVCLIALKVPELANVWTMLRALAHRLRLQHGWRDNTHGER